MFCEVTRACIGQEFKACGSMVGHQKLFLVSKGGSSGGWFRFLSSFFAIFYVSILFALQYTHEVPNKQAKRLGLLILQQ